MAHLKSQNIEDERNESAECLGDEELLGDLQMNDLLESHLAALQTQNPDAYTILVEKIRDGFFEESQGKKIFADLADQILLTILIPEKENAN